jgi:hypothetical protein
MKSLHRFAWLCLLAIFAVGCSGRSTEAKIQTKDGYEVRITTDTFVDVQSAFYCELWHNGTLLKPPCYFESTALTRYELVEGAPNEVFKIVDGDTRATLVLFDRRTGEAWPWTSATETFEETHQRMHRLESEFIRAEQAGTGQPATRSQSKSEGSDKPQPDAEGRSR